MIPKVIHYCWFGKATLPDSAKKCIESWKKYCPDYEIKEWNENNFNLDICSYVKEAYQNKKWAFVSDYARLWVLYQYGGIYFDTDVEIISSLDDIISKGPFMGCENIGKVNPGLGLGMDKNHAIIKQVLENYNMIHFCDRVGNINYTTIVTYTTNVLNKYGLQQLNAIQNINGIYIYPPDYFSPINYETGEFVKTNNTRTIHHFAGSWLSPIDKKIATIKRKYSKKPFPICYLENIVSFPYRLSKKINKLGFVGTIKFSLNRIGKIFHKKK